MKIKPLDILGTIYSIKIYEESDDLSMFYDNGIAGYQNGATKEIAIRDFSLYEETSDIGKFQYQVDTIRHELIHAYLYESGLYASSNAVTCWALNEEMVDWIALQLPKITRSCDLIIDYLRSIYDSHKSTKED